jgi:hypothetical protein
VNRRSEGGGLLKVERNIVNVLLLLMQKGCVSELTERNMELVRIHPEQGIPIPHQNMVHIRLFNSEKALAGENVTSGQK